MSSAARRIAKKSRNRSKLRRQRSSSPTDRSLVAAQTVDEPAQCPLAEMLGHSTSPEISDDDKKKMAKLIPEVLSQLPRLLELRNTTNKPTARVRIPGSDRFFYAFEADPDGMRFYGTWTPIEGVLFSCERHWGLFEFGIDARNGQPFVYQVSEGPEEIEGTPFSMVAGTAVCGVWREEYPDKRTIDDLFVNKIAEHEMNAVTEDGLWEMLSRLPDVENFDANGGAPKKVVKIRGAGRMIFAFAANRRQLRIRGAWSDDRGNLSNDPDAWLDFVVFKGPDGEVAICPVTEAFRDGVRGMMRTGKNVPVGGTKVSGASCDEMAVRFPTDSPLMN